MGWSCRADAGRTMEAWTAACVAATKSQNRYVVNGVGYFWEVSRTEHADGAITGTVWREVAPPPESSPGTFWARKCGTFRIEGDGTVKRAPAWLKAVTVCSA